MKKLTSLTIALTLLLNLSACGTLFYPERIGKHHSNQVDIKIAVADGIGLLFFIVPGLIAFAVDYNNGSIYLPSRHSNNNSEESIKVVQAEQRIDHAYLETLIESELGLLVDLDADSTVIEKQNVLDSVQLFAPKQQKFAAYSHSR